MISSYLFEGPELDAALNERNIFKASLVEDQLTFKTTGAQDAEDDQFFVFWQLMRSGTQFFNGDMHLMICRQRFLCSFVCCAQVNEDDIVIMQLSLCFLEGQAVSHTVDGVFHDVGSDDEVIHSGREWRRISQIDVGELFSGHTEAHSSGHGIDTFV